MPKIDFYLYSPHEIAVWAPVVKQLRHRGADVRWVMEPPLLQKAESFIAGTNSNLVDDVVVETAVRMLAELGDVPLFKGRYEEADAAVTTGWNFWIGNYRNLKFKSAYGVGPFHNSVNFAAFSSNFDAVFTHGELSREKLSAYSPNEDIYVCGFPKYAPYFRGEVDIEPYRHKWGLDPAKKTILYCSTWAENASLDRFAAAISDLADDYNVLYKPHHCNLRWEASRYEFLRNHPNVVVDEETRSIVPFIAVADLVAADIRSGSFTEPMLMDTPVIGLSSGDKAKDDMIEEERIEEAAWVCYQPFELRGLVEAALAFDNKAAGRARLSERMFSDFRENADYVMAEAMLAKIRTVRESGDVSNDAHVITDLNQSAPEITVIVSGDETPANVLRCLESLNEQTVAPGTFDVVVVDSKPGRKHERIVRPDYYTYELRFVDSTDGPFAASSIAADQSRAKYLLFLNGDSCAGPETIASHLQAHVGESERAVMGTSAIYRRGPHDVLTQILDQTVVSYPYAAITDSNIDWTCFKTLNTSLPRAAFLRSGAFSPIAKTSIAADIDLGLRLSAIGVTFKYESSISVGRMRAPEFDALRSENLNAGAELVDVFARNPQALQHPNWSTVKSESLSTFAQAENLARSTGSDWTLLCRALPELQSHTLAGAGLEPSFDEASKNILTALRDMWIRMGIANGLRKNEVDSINELITTDVVKPWPIISEKQIKYIAWPDYRSPEDLKELMVFGRQLSDSDSCLVLRHDRAVDGDKEFAIAQLEAAYSTEVPDDLEIEIEFIAEDLQPGDIRRISAAVDYWIELPSAETDLRKAFGVELKTPVFRLPANS